MVGLQIVVYSEELCLFLKKEKLFTIYTQIVLQYAEHDNFSKDL
jgi:hypothetical protein